MQTSKPPPLWQHQIDGIRNALAVHNYAFFMEQGTGKTRTVIETLDARFKERGRILKTLILTPPIVVAQFRGEWLRYADVKPRDVIVLQGPAKKRLKTFLENQKEPKIFITNYEAMMMKDLFQAFLEWVPEAVVFDESQKIKSP